MTVWIWLANDRWRQAIYTVPYYPTTLGPTPRQNQEIILFHNTIQEAFCLCAKEKPRRLKVG
jgi:hypothetical protein